MDQATFMRYRELVHQHSGIALAEGKEALVSARVGKRMRELGLADHRDYLSYLEDDRSGTELVQLLDAVSTNVTSFYREPAHFDRLKQELQRRREAGQSTFRIWSAASSTGEEPYTIAMSVSEVLPVTADWRILATDISTRALATAQAGQYTDDKLKPVPAALRQRWLEPVKNERQQLWQVASELRQKVVYRRLNLSSPPFPLRGPLDVIFCRNVMIYFDRDTRQALVDEFTRLLAPDGLLMVGHAESLSGIRTSLETVSPSVYRQR